MAVVRVSLLVVGVVGVLVRPRRWPVWAVPVGAAALGLATRAVSLHGAGAALRPLRAPLAFLLLAVPLAVLLDQLGFFTALAARVGHGRHLHLGLWVLAAAVTTVFNLDASVVLLTPLYVRIAARHGLDPVATAFPPALLACLASSALPVSNLTNLLAAERFDVSALRFVVHLAPASLAATAVGYLAYRRAFPHQPSTPPDDEPVDRRALALGIPVVVVVLVGFTVGDAAGIPAWAVAGGADIALVTLVRRLPWRDLPWGAAALAGALAVLVGAAAPHLGVDRLVAGGDTATHALALIGIATVAANLLNNLPALLVLMTGLTAADGRLWAVLVGVNVGPLLVVSGSLSGLLWLDTARRLGVDVDARDYSRIGVRVGVPALAAAGAVVILTNRLVG